MGWRCSPCSITHIHNAVAACHPVWPLINDTCKYNPLGFRASKGKEKIEGFISFWIFFIGPMHRLVGGLPYIEVLIPAALASNEREMISVIYTYLYQDFPIDDGGRLLANH
jgi:hypothetical protein